MNVEKVITYIYVFWLLEGNATSGCYAIWFVFVFCLV